MQNSAINNFVSILYYPGQSDYPFGHAELEVGGICYTQSRIITLDHRIARARDGGLPFWRCHISVTPQQLAHLQDDAKTRKGASTCMQRVGLVLADSADFHIPSLIRLSPLASYLYLKGAKALGSTRVTKIESFGFTNPSRADLVGLCLGVISEIAVTAFIPYAALSCLWGILHYERN